MMVNLAQKDGVTAVVRQFGIVLFTENRDYVPRSRPLCFTPDSVEQFWIDLS
jgi:hypothetical protein